MIKRRPDAINNGLVVEGPGDERSLNYKEAQALVWSKIYRTAVVENIGNEERQTNKDTS